MRVYTTTAVPGVGDPPVNTVAPHVSGIGDVGAVLSCSTGTWTNSPTAYAYRWYQEGTPIIGATASTYTTIEANRGHSLTCGVTASNAFGGGTAQSNDIFIGGALYNYENNNTQFVPAGGAYCPTNGQLMRINQVDASGNNHVDTLTQLVGGDKITIGAITSTLNSAPTQNGDVWVCPVTVPFPSLANGQYTVTVQKA